MIFIENSSNNLPFGIYDRNSLTNPLCRTAIWGLRNMIPLFNDFKNSYTEIGLPVVLRALTLRTDFEEINRLG